MSVIILNGSLQVLEDLVAVFDVVSAELPEWHLLSIISDFLHLAVHHVHIEYHLDELLD